MKLDIGQAIGECCALDEEVNKHREGGQRMVGYKTTLSRSFQDILAQPPPQGASFLKEIKIS